MVNRFQESETGLLVPEIPPRTFFSVLIALRNAGPFVDECLDSLLAQTFPSWNALVWDDASDDDSWARIQAKVGRDTRFRLHRNEARVSALPNLMQMSREATGDYCLILDGDDALIGEHALDTIFAVYADAPDVIATSGQYIRWPDGGVGHCSPHSDDWFVRWPFGHTLTYKREVCVEMMDRFPQAYLDPETGEPYRSTYDLALYYPVVAWAEWNKKQIAHINTPTYLYRRHQNCDDFVDLKLQNLCARKIQLYWMSEMYKHDAQPQAGEVIL